MSVLIGGNTVLCPICQLDTFNIIQSGTVSAIGKCSNCKYSEPLQRTESEFVRCSIIWSEQAKQRHARLLQHNPEFVQAEKILSEIKTVHNGKKVEDLVRVQCVQSKKSDEIWVIRKCPFCGQQHHHTAGTGPRVAHCHDGKDEYYLTLDPIVTLPKHHKQDSKFSLNIQNRSFSLRIRFKIFKRDKYHCQVCGRGAEDGVKLELGHKIAKSKGGQLEENNLVTLCFDCNRGQYTDEL